MEHKTILWLAILVLATGIGYLVDKLFGNNDDGNNAGLLIIDGKTDTTNQHDHLDDIVDDASDSECLESNCHSEDTICGT